MMGIAILSASQLVLRHSLPFGCWTGNNDTAESALLAASANVSPRIRFPLHLRIFDGLTD